MTDADLQAVRERADRATPGPWIQGDLLAPWLRPVYWKACDRSCPHFLFLAHAREDVPNLLAEVERLHAAIRLLADLCGGVVVTDGDTTCTLAHWARRALEGKP